MRSANKKHGNIGDVEVTLSKGGLDIIESWDAKYGKPYLRDELDELGEKLAEHPENEIVGFITDTEPNMKNEITDAIEELESIHGNQVRIYSFEEWFEVTMTRFSSPEDIIIAEWLTAITESICQLRRDRAPIDEPSLEWVQTLHSLLK